MSIKQKVCSYYLGLKVVFRNWILVVSVVSGLVVNLFSVQNVKIVTMFIKKSLKTQKKLKELEIMH